MSKIRGRTLVVQTETGNSGLPHRFGKKFEDIFYFNSSLKTLSISKFREVIQLSTSFSPQIFNNEKSNFSYSLEIISKGVHDTHKLKFFNKYSDDVVVHESNGGGLSSASLLSKINLQKNYQDALQIVLKSLPKKAIGIHFRSSDYKSNFEVVIDLMQKIDNEKIIFLATDDISIVSKLNGIFPEKQFLSSGFLRSTTSEFNSSIDAAVMDLFLLAACAELHVIPLISTDDNFPKYSGFGRLAKHIWTVNKIRQEGWVNWLKTDSPLAGCAGFDQRWMNFLYLVLYELPRIYIQASRPKGIYHQLSKILEN